MDDKLSNDTNKPNRVYRLHELNPLAFELLGSDSKNINNNNNNENKMDATNKSLDQPNETNPSDRCNENSQSNASGENSDNNSTDNISLGSDDLIDNIVILPNNFLSDDEQSTNSDDCVYAYRGADGFEPIADDAVNADDETDYLEMDFEPDPVSEVEVDAEVDSRQFNGPNAGANFCPNNAASSTVHTESSSVGVQHEARPSGLDPNSQKGSQEQNSTTGNSGISQPMLMGSSIRQQNNNKIRCCCHLEDGECSNTQHSTNSDNGKTPVTLKKYTGTIPKNTNRQQSRLQRIKPSTSTATPECSSVATDKSGSYSSTSKRSKNDSQKMSSEKSTPESDVAVSIRPIPSPSRSMSFPGEMFLSHAHPSTSGTSTANAQRTGIESYSPSRSHRSHSCLDFTDIVELNRSTATDNIYSTALVSYECSTESILAALVSAFLRTVFICSADLFQPTKKLCPLTKTTLEFIEKNEGNNGCVETRGCFTRKRKRCKANGHHSIFNIHVQKSMQLQINYRGYTTML